MPKTAIITARMDPDLKKTTEAIFKRLGLSPTQAITLFYRQVDLNQGLPFSVSIPNPETRQALDDAQARRNVERFDNASDLLD